MRLSFVTEQERLKSQSENMKEEEKGENSFGRENENRLADNENEG